MSYYDPFYPAYESTRYEIQKTIYGLEDKLRRVKNNNLSQRKQLDLMIEKQFIQKQAIKHQQQLLSSQYTIQQITAQKELRESLRKLRMYDIAPMASIIPRMKQAIYPDLNRQRQLIQLDYLERLNALRREKQLFYGNNINNIQRQNYSLSKVRFQRNDDDEILVKKYQDGSKLNEYNQQLQASSNKSNSHTDRLASTKKQMYSDHRNFNNQSDNRTPFDKLKTSENHSQLYNSVQRPKAQFYNSKKKLYKEELQGMQKESNNYSPNLNSKLQKEQKHHKESFSPEKRAQFSSKSPNKRQRKSRQNNPRQNDISKIDSTQGNALKKIQNRLIVSSVIYEDSKYKNMKHQLSHLFSTYENELKIRKDIKDKINHHPMILRKHAMVVQ